MRGNRRVRTLAMAGAASLALFAAGTAQAQTNEVQELRNQVKQLLERIEKLEKAPPAAAPTAAPSGNPFVSSATPKVKFTLGGWIHRAAVFADDGFDTDTLFVDNNGASSRILGTATGKINDTWTAGTVLEIEAISNNSRTAGIQQNAPGAFAWNERKMEVWFEGKGFGRVWFGQGDVASQATSEVDLSGTANLGGYSDVGATFGGLQFRNSATQAFGPTVNTVTNNFDGLNRDDRIRYDTPTFNGFQAMTSVLDGGAWDVALRYSGKVGETTVGAAIAYADSAAASAGAGAGVDNQVNGSVSVRLASGFNLTAAAGSREYTVGRDSEFWYVKAGYINKINSLGNTAFAVDYYSQEDNFQLGDEASAWGAYIVQYLDAISSEIYVGLRNHEYDQRTANFEDVFGVITGARVRF